MSFPVRLAPLQRASLIAIAALAAAGFAAGQSAPAQSQSSSASYSSSQAGVPQLAELALPDAPTPETSGAEGGQYGQGGGGYHGGKHGLLHRLTFEAGGGFNAPISSSVTYGGDFTIGGGLKFNPHFSTLIEYQFIDDKLPGALISETNGAASGGHAHIWSFTLDPVFDLFPKAGNDVYVTGGGGFYRKVTTFTFPMATEFCSYFYCGTGYVPGTVGHFSSNQGGFNVGGGYQHRFGSMYGDESNTAFFAEVRYLDVLSPAIVGKSANGLPPVTIDADTKLLPVSVGIRW
jgi:hypothetical protein